MRYLVANNLYTDSHLGWFDKIGAERPEHIGHIKEDEIDKAMTRLMPNSWRLEGNMLIGQTEVGPLHQTIDPNYILTGTDDKGLPVFQKIKPSGQ